MPPEIPLFLLKQEKLAIAAEEEEGPAEDKANEDSKKEEASNPQPGDAVRDASQKAACFQEIAKTSAFTMAMFSPMNFIMKVHGVHHYRNIHWEAGLIGHVLYLEGNHFFPFPVLFFLFPFLFFPCLFNFFGSRGTGTGCNGDGMFLG